MTGKEMEPIACVGLIPAENPARRGQSLNVLVMAVNRRQEARTTVVRVFGRVEEDWKELTAQTCSLQGGEHAHLYFNIPAQWTTPSAWEVEELEELALTAGTSAPEPWVPGVLIFFRPEIMTT